MVFSRVATQIRPLPPTLMNFSFLPAVLVTFSIFGIAFQEKTQAQTPIPDLAKLGPRDCRVLVEAKTGEMILREGACGIRHSPCSTFKLPLAVMGFDSGILKNAHTPA